MNAENPPMRKIHLNKPNKTITAAQRAKLADKFIRMTNNFWGTIETESNNVKEKK